MVCREDCLYLVTVHRMKKGKTRCAYCGKFDLLLKVRSDGKIQRARRCRCCEG